MSLPENRTITGDCGHIFCAQAWRSVNTSDPDLVELFLQGTLNFVKCPTCGELTDVRSPFVYQDLTRSFIVFIYDPDLGDDDPLPKLDPMLRQANAALGVEMLSVDCFEAAREAIEELGDPALLATLRSRHPQWSEAQVCVEYIRGEVENSGLTRVFREFRELRRSAEASEIDSSDSPSSPGHSGDKLYADLGQGVVEINAQLDSEKTTPEQAHLRLGENTGLDETRAAASLTGSIVEKHQVAFERKQRAVVERLGQNLQQGPRQQTFGQAFRESAQPNAPVPRGWWIFPTVGLVVGIALVLYAGVWGVVLGTLLLACMLFLLFAGAVRAQRNRRL